MLTQGNIEHGRVEGKEYRTNGMDTKNMAVIADSHHSFNMNYWKKHGVFCMAIRGGGVWHAERALQSVSSACYFILLGGNDISKLGGEGTIERLGDLVSGLTRKEKTEIEVTGSMIPRAGKMQHVGDMRFANEQMYKIHTKHHHFTTTVFETNGMITQELYIGDKIHLNEDGLAVYRQVLDWVVNCVNRGVFEERLEMEVVGETKQTWWEF